MKNFVFLGPPGCGKGTQAEMFASRFNFAKVSTGELLRDIAKQETELGIEIHKVLTSGDLVSDEMVNKLIDSFYSNVSTTTNVILDGYPRSIEQANTLDVILSKYKAEVNQVFYFDLAEDILVKRITGRYTCANCGAIYNKFFHVTAVEAICDKCNGVNFIYRSDDSEEIIKNRLRQFEMSTKPLLGFYANKIKLVDANRSSEDVFKQITNFLDI